MKRVACMLIVVFALRGEGPAPCAVRSIVTAPAGLTDTGVLVLELGGGQAYGRDDAREGGLKAQFDLGINSWIDLRCGWTGRAWWRDAGGRGEGGVGDPYLGGQLLFVGQEKAGIDLGLVYSHLLPLANARKGLSAGFHEDTLFLAVSRAMGRWSMDLNLGCHRTKDPGNLNRVNQKIGSLAFTYAPAQGWNLTLDNYAVGKSEVGGQERGSILAASYELSDRLKVDLGTERGWVEASPRFAFNVGLMYRLAKLWPH